MSDKKLKFALFGNIYQTKKSSSVQRIISYLSEHDAELYIEKDFYEFLMSRQRLDLSNAKLIENDDFNTDFVISMGGDGTFLKAASHVGGKGIPILGINIGRLGFLADVSPDDVEKEIEALYNGDYKIESRSVIKVETEGSELEGCPYALNDVALLKKDNASMISIRTSINGEYLTTFQADGLVVSTPTGSTAYSLSIGGPIIVPQSSTLSLTAVAPHSLNIRPIVVTDDSVITLTVESRSHYFLIGIDGRSERCGENTKLTISKAPFKIKVIKRRGHQFFHTLREKLMWGADTRE